MASCLVRYWSLITGRGLQHRRGGASEVLPLRKGGQKKFSHAGRGGGEGVTNGFEIVSTGELEVLAILKWGTNSFHP